MNKINNDKWNSAELDKCWRCIGRFLWQFGIIESWVNEVFVALFDVEPVAFMFIGEIDTRKTLDLIKAELAEKGDIAHNKIIGSVHEFHTRRNVIVHSCFHLAEDGIDFDHITREGKRWTTSEGDDREDFVGNNHIAYAEFGQLVYGRGPDYRNSDSAISSPSRELQARIEKIINRSPNIVRYPIEPSTQ